MTDEEKAAVKRDYPKHIFCRVEMVFKGVRYAALLALPCVPGPFDPPVKNMPGMTLAMLAGATLHLGDQ